MMKAPLSVELLLRAQSAHCRSTAESTGGWLLLLLPMTLFLLIAPPPAAAASNNPLRVWTDEDFQQLATPATAPLPVGTIITPKNWEQYQDYMTETMRVMFRGDHHFKMPPDLQIVVGPRTPLPLPKLFQAATEKYSGSATLAPAPSIAPGALMLQGYKGGLPFPDPKEPNRAMKIEYDSWFTYSPTNNYQGVPVIISDRFGDNIYEYVEAVEGRPGYNYDPSHPEFDPLMPDIYKFTYDEITTPEELKYTASLNQWHLDPLKFTDLYAFVPALRRVLRLSPAAVCSPIAGTDVTNDDDCSNGSNCQQLPLFAATLLGEKKVLAIANLKLESLIASFTTALGDPKYWYTNPDEIKPLGGWLMPRPSAASWELRDVYVVAVRRLPSLRKGYCYGTRVFYIDKENWHSISPDLWDSQQRYWKGGTYFFTALPIPGTNGDVADTISEGTLTDLQNYHQSSGIRVKLDLNGNAGKFADTRRYGTVAGLQQIMQ